MKKLFNKINEKPRLKKVLKLLGVIGICLSVVFNGLIIGVAIAEKCRNNNDNTINNVATTPVKNTYYPQGQEGMPLWVPYSIFYDNYYFDNPSGFFSWATNQFEGFNNDTYPQIYKDVTMPYQSIYYDVDPTAYEVYVQNGGVGINYLNSNCLNCDVITLYRRQEVVNNRYPMYSFFLHSSSTTLRPYFEITNYPGVYGGCVYNLPNSSRSVYYDKSKGIMILSNNPLYNIFNHDYENASQSYDEGYKDGYDTGYNWGKTNGQNDGYREGYENGSIDGYNSGYQAGITENMENADWSPFTLLSNAFNAVASVLNINILPGMSLGLLVFIPVIVAVIIVVVKMIKG